jgi:predicted dehydrogenase
MSGRALRVAVVGVGYLGRIHARILAENPASELVGVVDTNETRARAVADELGCLAAGNVEDLPGRLDAAVVVVPTRDHARIAVPLLERGIPCLVEKPLAENLEQADQIIAAAQRGGAALAVGHVERFEPGVRKVQELGLQPRFIECHRLSTFNFRGRDVGVVHDLMIHDLDLVLHFIGSPIASLDASGGAILTDHEDLASVRLVFENGARANVTASRVSLTPMRRFRLFSSSSYVSLDFTKNYGILVRKGKGWEKGREELRTKDPSELMQHESFIRGNLLDVVELELAGEKRPLQAELDSFLGCIERGERPEVGGVEGRAALELAERICTEIRAQVW